MYTEKELVELAQSGDNDAFGALIKSCAEKIYGLSLHLTGNTNDAKDLWQESVLEAFKSISRFQHKSSFSSWLYSITVNHWKDKIKHQKSRKYLKYFSLDRATNDEKDEFLRLIPDRKDNPETEIENNQDKELVWNTLNELKPEMRMVLVLREIDSKSYEEIAELLGCTLSTIKWRLFKAREMFRQRYLRNIKVKK